MRMYYYQQEEKGEDLVFFLSVFACVTAVWWLVLHLVDWLTFDAIPWWGEPLTIFLVLPIVMLVTEYGKNPVMWWPVCFGTKIKLDPFSLVDPEDIQSRYGGRLNVYFGLDDNLEPYLKFRRKRDAVFYNLSEVKN